MASQRKAGAILGYANIIVKNLVNLVYTPLLLSFVGQADYGVYQTANSFIFSLSLLSFGFSQAYVRFYARAERCDDGGAQIRSLNGMYLMLYAVVCAVALLAGLVFSYNVDTVFAGSFTPDQVDLARVLMSIMSVNIAITLFSTVFDAFIMAREEFRFQQSRQILTTLLTPCAAFLFLSAGMGTPGVASAQLLISLVLLLLNARYAIGSLGMRFNIRRFDRGLFGTLVAFSAWIFANQVCDLVNQNVPNVILGARTSATIVAVFSVSIQIRNLFVSLSTTMSSVFTPKINRIVATTDDNAELTQLMTRLGRYQMILFCWVYGGFALLGSFFISKWAGPSFSEAYGLILVMALPLAVPLTQNTGVEIQRAKNRHKARSVILLAMAVINIAFTWAAAPTLGCWAPAIAYCFTILVGNGIAMNWYYHCRIGLDMRLFWSHALPVTLVALLVTIPCAAILRFFPVTSWFSFIAWGVLYSACFACAIWRFILSQHERQAIGSHLPFMRR